jgi:hypothetical protein
MSGFDGMTDAMEALSVGVDAEVATAEVATHRPSGKSRKGKKRRVVASPYGKSALRQMRNVKSSKPLDDCERDLAKHRLATMERTPVSAEVGDRLPDLIAQAAAGVYDDVASVWTMWLIARSESHVNNLTADFRRL